MNIYSAIFELLRADRWSEGHYEASRGILKLFIPNARKEHIFFLFD